MKNTLAYYSAELNTTIECLTVRPQGLCSQHFIFFTTYEWAQQAKVLYYNRLERLARDKHFNLLGLFLSCEENEVL